MKIKQLMGGTDCIEIVVLEYSSQGILQDSISSTEVKLDIGHEDLPKHSFRLESYCP